MKSRSLPCRPQSEAQSSVASFARAVILDRLRTAASLAAEVRTRPTEKVVHDVRVACRRARDTMAFFDGVDGVPSLPDVDRAARRMAKAVRAVREIAVAIRAMEAFAPASRSPKTNRARRCVIAALRHRERSIALAERKRVATRAMNLERAVARALPALADGTRETRDPETRRFLACRVTANKATALRRVRALAPWKRGDKPPYRELHRIRVCIKHWRYAVEIGFLATPDDQASHKLVTRLRSLQDAGGKTQDLADLTDIVRAQLRTLRQSDAAGGLALLSQIRVRRRRAAASFVRALRAQLGDSGGGSQKI
jgi:CHAD domain-containing protein